MFYDSLLVTGLADRSFSYHIDSSIFLMFTVFVGDYLSFTVLTKMHFTTFIYNFKLSLNFG